MELPKSLFGKLPSHQNGVDLFRHTWACSFPSDTGVESGGFAASYDDDRIHWAERALGGLRGARILELGPLEGGQSFVLEKAGAESVLAIEVNPKAYLKCLIAKEVYGLTRSTFLLGDFVTYLEANVQPFDVCIACGVLYHMQEPLKVLRNVSRACRKVFIWSHYFDEAVVAADPELASRFGDRRNLTLEGHTFHCYPHGYGRALEDKRFCGGEDSGSVWLTLESLLRALEVVGYQVVDQKLEEHVNGPAAWIAAEWFPGAKSRKG